MLRERRRGLKLANDQRAAELIPFAHAEAALMEVQATFNEEAERLCDGELADDLAAADERALIRARLKEAARDVRQRVTGYLGGLGARAK